MLKRTMTGITAASLLVAVSFAVAADIPRTASAEGATVTIVSPKDGDTVSTEVTVIFGLQGMGVAPAGTDREFTGHHHLLVDQTEVPDPTMPLGKPPIHFGGGQTQTTLTLTPGVHTLQLILGDKSHVPHQPPLISEKITITVK